MGKPISFSELDLMFFEEAAEMLENASTMLVEVEKSTDVMSAIPEVFRTFHTIKGGAQLVGCDMLAAGKRRVCCFDRSGKYSRGNMGVPEASE